MEINGIEFVCDSIHSDYEKHAVELAQAYEKRLPDIVDYLMPDIKEMFGITNPDVIANSLGKPSIDLDRGTLTYLEHTMDSLHIIEMEFDGIFTAFYNSCIDGQDFSNIELQLSTAFIQTSDVTEKQSEMD